ncbi:hypothetical protein F4815DRAFT_308530 [Daldinia loculata]|uniref:uncharacterized protein n=1 Tax=Daldinia loculata TaxID=103429 RepID=UPI0020C38065|nr:uncharacterized protein F4817DRAFT_313298 [Daldinia loculata]KAI1649993.1 hypothetical protein F4817DRAFT_313298 [Daldinia loculata]KAI2783667.1 hypothetical protein F4815DRAFT_308530 [Daldinia loculata]
MKRQHIALPTLQVAAAAFFAASVQAETYCVDGATKVVAKTECDADTARAVGQFFLHQGPPGLTVGEVIPPPAEPGHVSGGFGRRSDDNCDPNKDKDCHSGG